MMLDWMADLLLGIQPLVWLSMNRLRVHLQRIMDRRYYEIY